MLPRLKMQFPFLMLVALGFSLTTAGCVEYTGYGPYSDDGMGAELYSDYDGSLHGDTDNVLTVVFEWPTGGTAKGRVADGPGVDYSASFGCYKNNPAWGDKPWWMEVRLYTDSDLSTLVSTTRVSPADCYHYTGEIAADGSMTIYPGYHPDDRRSEPRLTTLGKGVITGSGLAVVGAGLAGFVLWKRRR